MDKKRVFLNAQWKHLVMLNFPIEPQILQPFTPKGTEIDFFKGQTYVSLVAFMFLRTKVLGLGIPFHRDFEEVNLRFYVKRTVNGQTRRGVVFIKEIVPKPAIAFVARTIYNEKYIALPMKHHIQSDYYSYDWKYKKHWNYLRVKPEGRFFESESGSLEEFITEHYFGYAKLRDGNTSEYEVTHPRWQVCHAKDIDFKVDMGQLYGSPFEKTLSLPPASAFIANGSEVKVYQGIRI